MTRDNTTSKLALLVAALWVLTAVMFLRAGSAAAQETAAEPVFTSEAGYAFGQEMRFRLAIENAAGLEEVTLFFRPEKSTNLYTVEVPFTPGETVTVEHVVGAAPIDLLPYDAVFYSWQVVVDGVQYAVPEQSFTYEDDRFTWQQMTQEGATAHWTGNGPFFGQEVLDITKKALKRLATLMPLEEVRPFDIYVYGSSADLRSGLRLAGLDGSLRRPDLDVILVTAVNPATANSELAQSLPYELAHLLLYRVSGAQYEQMPAWLKEGLATVVQEEPHPRAETLLAEAVEQGTTLPLAQLCQDWPETEDRALLAAAQSASVTDFILRTYGEETFVELVGAYAQGGDCLEGAEKVLNSSLVELDRAWLAAVQAPDPFGAFVDRYGLWLLLFMGGFGITGLIYWQSVRG